MYKYETHLHTSPVSKCAIASVRESLEFYKSLGYDGVFITNHFIQGNMTKPEGASYEELVEFYFTDYEAGAEMADEIGIKVFCGVEISHGGTDFLVFGLDKAWFLAHPEILEMKFSDELRFMQDAGAFIAQAHPFREAGYIDHIRLFPRCIEAVEIINASMKEQTNALGKIYCESYDLIPIAGSDNHVGKDKALLAGVCTQRPIESVFDFVSMARNRELQTFVYENKEI